jgi:transcriptional regulator with XRE-family HTH domain
MVTIAPPKEKSVPKKPKPRPVTILSEVPDLDTLGGRIHRARQASDLTTAELALRVGVTTATATSWETNHSEPRANRLAILAGVLNVSPTWLIFGLGESPSDETLQSELALLKSDLARARRIHAELDKVIGSLEVNIGRLKL